MRPGASVTVQVTVDSPGLWIVTSPELPGWRVGATSPLTLGTQVRTALTLASARAAKPLPPPGHELLTCVDCHTEFARVMRRGTKPKRCPDCAPSKRHLHAL